MMELAGIDMLPPDAGIPWIRRELTAGGTCGEVVVGQRLGVLLNEWDAAGGLDVQALASDERLAAHGPMVGNITGMGIYSGLTMETTLDPPSQPFLYDHRIDGTPVLPGVMGIEAFAEAAVCVHPGWYVQGVEEVNFLAPFKFYRDEPRTLTVQVMYYPEADRIVADCRLIADASWRIKSSRRKRCTSRHGYVWRDRRQMQSPGSPLSLRPIPWLTQPKSITFISTDRLTRLWSVPGGMESECSD